MVTEREWTGSLYEPYPGFEPLDGALGEYNGKFMCDQFVLRGGSCATSRTHIRPTDRYFFHAAGSWQFTGLRLARGPERLSGLNAAAMVLPERRDRTSRRTLSTQRRRQPGGGQQPRG